MFQRWCSEEAVEIFTHFDLPTIFFNSSLECFSNAYLHCSLSHYVFEDLSSICMSIYCFLLLGLTFLYSLFFFLVCTLVKSFKSHYSSTANQWGLVYVPVISQLSSFYRKCWRQSYTVKPVIVFTELYIYKQLSVLVTFLCVVDMFAI